MTDIIKLSDVKQVANELKKFVVEEKLYTNIQGKNFVHVEGWQFAGASMGLHAVVTDVTNSSDLISDTKVIKYTVKVDLFKGDQLFGSGVGFCSNEEKSKKYFDEYAIIAMAQTRAISRAYRNSIGWIMKLAGYESTPLEEMEDVGSKAGADDKRKEAIIEHHKEHNA